MRARHNAALAAACMAWLTIVAAPAVSEPAPVAHRTIQLEMDSGKHTNRSAVERLAYSNVIDGGETDWVRLIFSVVDLAPGSRIEVVSEQDGARQVLDTESLRTWQNSSAYFNGSRVRVELVSAAGASSDRIAIQEIIVGERSAQTRSQCGPTDDRFPSTEPERARLLNIGCTASIYEESSSNSCFITAGHCLSSPSQVNIVEFNVPPSLSNGSIQHPGPDDQYTVGPDREFINGGTGNDWGLFKAEDNTQTGLSPFEAQGALLNLAANTPPVSEIIRIVGYGVDSGTANQTQQEHSGPLVGQSGNRLDYQADTEGGNSGSAVTWPATGEVIGIHTHGGCNTGGGGANSGTAITHPNLQAALAGFCTVSAGVTCADIQWMRGRCQSNGNLQVLIRMTDTSNQGNTLTISVDGTPTTVNINALGGQFAFWQGGASSGAHTISLIDPAGCSIPDLTLTCP